MGDEFYTLLEASFFSTFRIIFLASCGFVLVKFKMVDKPIMKGLAEITANFLIPCLSVAEICKSFKINDWEMWLPLLVYCIVNVFLGYIIGLIISCASRTAETKRLVLIACMFSNSNSIQLIYVESLGPILAKMIGTSETEAKSRGYVIVLIYTIFVNFLRWSIGFNLMKPDKKENDFSYSKNESYNIRDLSLVNIADKLEIVEDGKSVTKLDEMSVRTSAGGESTNDSCLKILKEGMNMPFIAGVIAILLSSIPVVSTFFSDPKAYGFKLFTESCEAAGKCVSTIVILLLGLNLSISLKGNVDLYEPIQKSVILLVMITKALVFPFIGLFSVYYLGFKYNFITDPLVCFLLLTNFCTPTAINMITIAIINKFQVNNLSTLLIYQYVMGSITITIWTAVYMNLFLSN